MSRTPSSLDRQAGRQPHSPDDAHQAISRSVRAGRMRLDFMNPATEQLAALDPSYGPLRNAVRRVAAEEATQRSEEANGRVRRSFSAEEKAMLGAHHAFLQQRVKDTEGEERKEARRALHEFEDLPRPGTGERNLRPLARSTLFNVSHKVRHHFAVVSAAAAAAAAGEEPEPVPLTCFGHPKLSGRPSLFTAQMGAAIIWVADKHPRLTFEGLRAKCESTSHDLEVRMRMHGDDEHRGDFQPRKADTAEEAERRAADLAAKFLNWPQKDAFRNHAQALGIHGVRKKVKPRLTNTHKWNRLRFINNKIFIYEFTDEMAFTGDEMFVLTCEAVQEMVESGDLDASQIVGRPYGPYAHDGELGGEQRMDIADDDIDNLTVEQVWEATETPLPELTTPHAPLRPGARYVAAFRPQHNEVHVDESWFYDVTEFVAMLEVPGLPAPRAPTAANHNFLPKRLFLVGVGMPHDIDEEEEEDEEDEGEEEDEAEVEEVEEDEEEHTFDFDGRVFCTRIGHYEEFTKTHTTMLNRGLRGRLAVTDADGEKTVLLGDKVFKDDTIDGPGYAAYGSHLLLSIVKKMRHFRGRQAIIWQHDNAAAHHAALKALEEFCRKLYTCTGIVILITAQASKSPDHNVCDASVFQSMKAYLRRLRAVDPTMLPTECCELVFDDMLPGDRILAGFDRVHVALHGTIADNGDATYDENKFQLKYRVGKAAKRRRKESSNGVSGNAFVTRDEIRHLSRLLDPSNAPNAQPKVSAAEVLALAAQENPSVVASQAECGHDDEEQGDAQGRVHRLADVDQLPPRSQFTAQQIAEQTKKEADAFTDSRLFTQRVQANRKLRVPADGQPLSVPTDVKRRMFTRTFAKEEKAKAAKLQAEKEKLARREAKKAATKARNEAKKAEAKKRKQQQQEEVDEEGEEQQQQEEEVPRAKRRKTKSQKGVGASGGTSGSQKSAPRRSMRRRGS